MHGPGMAGEMLALVVGCVVLVYGWRIQQHVGLDLVVSDIFSSGFLERDALIVDSLL